jgi:hypothetical protein
MLKFYYDALGVEGYTFEMLVLQYEVALMDLVRFLVGWSRQKKEGMHNCYAYIRVQKLMQNIRNGVDSATVEEYRDLIDLKYNF